MVKLLVWLSLEGLKTEHKMDFVNVMESQSQTK